MDFYISWSHSDAIFCDYFDECCMLISAVPDNKYGVKKFKKKPQKLIIDSGALFYSKNPGKYKLKDILEIQKFIIDSAPPDIPIKLVHLDEPLLNKNTLSEKFSSVEKTLFNAYEYLNLMNKSNLPKNVSLMGVIQGYDMPSTKYCIFELKKMGFENLGLGSMLARSPLEQVRYMKSVTEIVGPENLHIFGVTGIEQIKEMAKLNILSFDSSRPTMVAAFHQIFYSNPFRTYVISESNVKRRNLVISKPLYCQCPVCMKEPQDILNISHRYYMKLRSIHNYYHLAKTIEDIKISEGVL
ncbi:7-cyano-7-deazaguanine tRNA-ribosyltransferase [Bacillus sp. SLBN-46]|uniref:queuine tRNA-ribosyltransferase n=1 Tax=Bacillus sp. SLBN-46 TaxID=3042283 RepID=UPI0028586D07|nr:queuine tRNA-ribosyltransferase [Bacillus sp. SLBN-46]MDR6123508.1 7-cyano-7-deazaguanine tRNA-ribosyltransferase [Bacillus sp. SLBN-46]